MEVAGAILFKCQPKAHTLKIILALGLNLAILWSFVFTAEKVNQEGIRYYNDTINALLANKIIPIVTLYYWDLPEV